MDPLTLGSIQSIPLIDEFQLMMGDDIYDLWLRTRGVAPHWFFAWAGGIALARYTLDNVEPFVDSTVIDIGCGTGLNTVAALRAGADHVFAIDRNRYSRELTVWNLEINRSPSRKFTVTDTVPQFSTVPDNTVVLLGDVFYESAQLLTVIDDALEHNCTVLVGDPGREYTPFRRLIPLQTYTVPNQQLLEKRDYIGATVYRATSNTVED